MRVTRSGNRDVKAGCFICHPDGIARWFGNNAQGVAVRHHDATGHETWVDVYFTVRYGREGQSVKEPAE